MKIAICSGPPTTGKTSVLRHSIRKLQDKGERVAFVTTAGFKDLLYLQRHDRRNIYNLHYEKPEPVVARPAT